MPRREHKSATRIAGLAWAAGGACSAGRAFAGGGRTGGAQRCCGLLGGAGRGEGRRAMSTDYIRVTEYYSVTLIVSPKGHANRASKGVRRDSVGWCMAWVRVVDGVGWHASNCDMHRSTLHQHTIISDHVTTSHSTTPRHSRTRLQLSTGGRSVRASPTSTGSHSCE